MDENAPSALTADHSSDAAAAGALDFLAFSLARCQVLLLARHAEGLAKHALTEKQYTLLRLIAAVDHRSQREVGTQLYIDRTTVVQLIDQLGAAGLVRRQRSEKDRRNITVGLTPRGLRRLGAAAKTLHQVEEEFLAPLATQERAVLREALRTLASHHSRAEMLASRNNE